MLTNSCKKEHLTVLPILTTYPVTDITQTTGVCGGEVTSDGGATVSAHGICWSTGTTPTTADGKASNGDDPRNFVNGITGLAANTTYSVRSYAVNSAGTGYGSVVSFTTLKTQDVTDIDSNVYHAVTIGTQTWMVENLKEITYNDGTPIELITNLLTWSAITTAGYCWYNNNADNKDTYGALYNGYAVNTGKLCPIGWHVPTNDEWTILTTYLGGVNAAGNKLRETGTAHWIEPNADATNESGFTALPGGDRGTHGGFSTLNGFSGLGGHGSWWSS